MIKSGKATSRSPVVALGMVMLLVLTAMATTTEPATGSDTSTIRRPVSYGKPNQSRVWFNSARDRWDALIPQDAQGGGVSASDHYIMTDVDGSRTFTDIELEDRDFARPDAYWDDASRMLYVLSSHPAQVEFWRVGYDVGNDGYAIQIGAIGAGVVVPGMTHPDTEIGGDSPASVHVGPNGAVWVAVMTDDGLKVQHSADGGANWLQAPVVVDGDARLGVTTWTDVMVDGEQRVGLFAGENGEAFQDTDYLFFHIANDADPTNASNWTDESGAIPQAMGSEQSDDHVSAAGDSAGNVYFAVKTEGGGPSDPLIKLYRRTPDGRWTQHKITETQEVPEQSRPSIVIDEQARTISVYVNGAEVVGSDRREAGRFRASLDSLDDLAGAEFVPLFDEPGTVFTDVMTPRHPVTAQSGIVVLAHNRTDTEVWVSAERAEPPTSSITATVDQDSWLRQRSRTRNYGDDDELEVKSRSRSRERAVVRFDLSEVPPGATIESAQVRFYVTNPDDDTVRIYRVTDDWTEFGVTWRNTRWDFDWRTVHGSFRPSEDESFVSADVTSLVQAWSCGTPNHGMMLIAKWGGRQSKYASREFGQADLRPSMEIELSTDSTSSAVC